MARHFNLRGRSDYAALREQEMQGEAEERRSGAAAQQSRCPQGHELEWTENTSQERPCTICRVKVTSSYICPDTSCRYTVCRPCYELPEDAFAKKVTDEHRCDLGHVLLPHVTTGFGLCNICEQGLDEWYCSQVCFYEMCADCHKLTPAQALAVKKEVRRPLVYRPVGNLAPEEEEVETTIRESTQMLIKVTLWEMDALFALRIASLMATWVACRLEFFFTGLLIMMANIAVSTWREREMVRSMRFVAADLHDQNYLVLWPYTENRILHPHALPRLQHFAGGRKCILEKYGPLVSYWVYYLLFPPEWSFLHSMDQPLDAFAAGAAMAVWPAERRQRYQSLWGEAFVDLGLPSTIGDTIGWLGPPGMLTLSLALSTSVQVLAYLYRRFEGVEQVGKLAALAELSGLWLVRIAAARMGIPTHRHKRALFTYFCRTVCGSVPSLWFLTALLQITYDDHTHLSLLFAVLCLFTSLWAICKTAYECAPPIRGKSILLIWIPLALVIAENFLRMCGIWVCETHQYRSSVGCAMEG